MERELLDAIQEGLRCGFLDVWMPWISWICNHGEVWILLAAVLLCRKKTRRAGLTVALALILDLICCNWLIKPLVGRPRPFAGMDLTLLVPPPADASFPSGHTASSFAAVFALRSAGSSLWIPALVLALLIAFSRLYLYVHWPSDVLCGALLGGLLGLLAGRVLNGMFRRREMAGKP